MATRNELGLLQELEVDICKGALYGELSSLLEAELSKDERTIRLNSEITLSVLLERARKSGEVRLLDGDDVFVLRFLDDRLPESAREFLIRGGPVEDD